MKKLILFMITAFVLMSPFHSGLTAAEDSPGSMVGNAVIMSATVEAIDKADRKITLKGPEGNVFTIVAGEEVRNFKEIKVGDEVHAEYYQSVAVSLGKPGEEPEVTASVGAVRAEKGKKPGAVAVETVDVVVPVRAIDRENRTVTFQGPSGILRTVGVDDGIMSYDQLKVGDTIQLRYTEAVAIWVTKEKPSGTVELEEVQVAFLASGSFGKGTLHFQGKTYPVKIGGLGIGGIGISTLEAIGDVYNLKNAEDFSGVYGQLRLGIVVANKSAGTLWLENTKGVKISLRSKRKGLMLSVGADGLIVKMKE
jgi:hypothetical protein